MARIIFVLNSSLLSLSYFGINRKSILYINHWIHPASCWLFLQPLLSTPFLCSKSSCHSGSRASPFISRHWRYNFQCQLSHSSLHPSYLSIILLFVRVIFFVPHFCSYPPLFLIGLFYNFSSTIAFVIIAFVGWILEGAGEAIFMTYFMMLLFELYPEG